MCIQLLMHDFNESYTIPIRYKRQFITSHRTEGKHDFAIMTFKRTFPKFTNE